MCSLGCLPSCGSRIRLRKINSPCRSLTSALPRCIPHRGRSDVLPTFCEFESLTPTSNSQKHLFHVALTCRSKVRFAPTYFLSATENKPSARSLAPPFRKKSRSAHLFGCKRLRDGSLSLPTFCELKSSTPTAKLPKISFSCGFNTRFCSDKAEYCLLICDANIDYSPAKAGL